MTDIDRALMRHDTPGSQIETTPRARCTIERCGAMTRKEAFDIVLALAFDNRADEKEMPEIYKQQSEALEIVAEIAKYYGSRRNDAGA